MITERGRALAHRPRVSPLRVPNLSEIDFGALRAGRLARLQAMMKRYDLPVCLFFGTANIRYATGVDVMGVWTAGTFARYCVVPAEGAPVLFEYKGSVHVAQKLVQDVRPAFTWQFGGAESAPKAREWAQSLRAVLREMGLDQERLAVDRLDTIGFLALQAEGFRVVDASPATVDAREVKTPEEIQLMAVNGGIGDAMLAEFEAAIRPGIREYELLAVLSDSLLRRHGEFLFTRLVASGTNTNPWLTRGPRQDRPAGRPGRRRHRRQRLRGVRHRRLAHVPLRGRPLARAEGGVPGRLRLRDRDGRARPAGDDVRGVRRAGAEAARGVPGDALPGDGPPGRARGRGAGHPVRRRRPGAAAHPAPARAQGEHGPQPRVLRGQGRRPVRREARGPGAGHGVGLRAPLHVPVRREAPRADAVPGAARQASVRKPAASARRAIARIGS